MNHDQPRVVSRLGEDGAGRVLSAKMLAMLLHGMQGTPFIYQGEEIGMTNPHFSAITQYRDVESLNAWQLLREQGIADAEILAVLAEKSRDNGRTPVQWDSSRNGGFTSGTSWIDLADNAAHITVASQREDADSVLYCYRDLIQLRKTLAILRDGDYRDLAASHDSLWCYQRQTANETLRVVANFTAQEITIPEEIALNPDEWRWLYGNYPRNAEAGWRLRPWECIWWLQG